MKSKIIQNGDPVLREMAKEVPLEEITSKKIKGIISRMKTALHKEEDGVAIAAPQIGESLRIFIVNGKTLAWINSPKDIDEKDIVPLPDEVYINPVITKLSKTKHLREEGCLSVRWLYGKVERSDKATVVAYDEHGKKFTRGAAGLLAQIFQHETDHLNGILFIDTAVDVEDLPPEKQHD